MKRYTAILVALLCCLPLFAQAQRNKTKDISSAVERAARRARPLPLPVNQGAIDSMVFVDFNVETTLQDPNNSEEFSLNGENKSCKLYAIDKNWLIGSIKCIGTAKMEYDADLVKTTVLKRQISSDMYLGLKGGPLKQREDENVFLFRQGDTEGEDIAINRARGIFLTYVGNRPSFVQALARRPKSLLYIPVKGKNIFSLFSSGRDNSLELNINTFCLGKDVNRARTLQPKSYVHGYFKVNTSLFDLSGEAGDPLFVINTRTHREYLAGFNAGDMFGTRGEMLKSGEAEDSLYFYDFNDKDYEFIQTTIQQKDPTAWKRISRNIVRAGL